MVARTSRGGNEAQMTQSNAPKSEWLLEPQSPARAAATWGTAKLAAGLQNLRGNLRSEGFGILMYHRIAARIPGVDFPTNNVTPDRFRRQMTGLLARGFESWPLKQLAEAHRDSRTVPSNVFAVTFDDGYENNFTNALPILRELNVHATIFLPTKYLDTGRSFPFDDWSASGTHRAPGDSWRPLSWRQCDELLASGLIEFGAHTHSHQRFTGRPAEFRDDTQKGLDILRDRFGIERPTFAFPYGEFDEGMVESARQMTLACAVNSKNQRVESGDDMFRWGRFHVGQSDTAAMLAAKLSGWYPMLAAAGRTIAPQLAWSPPAPSAQAISDRQSFDESLTLVAVSGAAKQD